MKDLKKLPHIREKEYGKGKPRFIHNSKYK